MSSSQHADQLLKWAAEQQLTAEQVQQAQQNLALKPQLQDWFWLAQRLLLSGAVILAASALIFFFAHNWPLMHYLSKLLLAAVVVLIAGMIATFTPYQSQLQKAALLGTALSTGALLALIGQIYQTGADIWQLFAAWAALITPLVLLSKSRLSYLLWFALIELALLRYLDLSFLRWLTSFSNSTLIILAVNFVLWATSWWLLPRLGVKQRQHLHAITMLALVIPTTYGAMLGPWQQKYQLNLLLFVVLAALAGGYFYRKTQDLLTAALWLFAAIAVTTSLLAKALDHADELLSFNLLAMFVIASSAGAAHWLRQQLKLKSAA